MLRSRPYSLRITVPQPEPRQTTGPSVTCVYHTYALIATPASPSQTIGITPFQHIHRAAPFHAGRDVLRKPGTSDHPRRLASRPSPAARAAGSAISSRSVAALLA